jgi:mannan endo-1,4-beta-mannosidase
VPRSFFALVLPALLLAFAAQSVSAQLPPAAAVDEAAFVRVSGTSFTLRGAPFHFLGANVAVMHGQAHRASMERILDAVRDDGLTVIRVWALGERPASALPWTRDYAFRIGEDGWVEASFEHLDRVLAAARERGLRVIVVLANRWSDYGGFPRYLRWAEALPETDSPRELTELESARFYDCERCDSLYRAHVRRVVERVNTVTGVAYRDDPTILAWELANELAAVPRDRDALVRWVTDSARFVRSLDSRHLISAGHIGYSRRSERDTWLAVQSLAEIDYADAHAYPVHSGRVRTLAELGRFVDDRAQLAHHVAHKPLVWGEYGFAGRRRLPWFDAFLGRSRLDGVEGALVWHYAPREAHADEHAIYPENEAANETRSVRRVLARHARRWLASPPAERNARLGEARGDEPLMPLDQELRGSAAPHARWSPAIGGVQTLSIAPRDFARARFEAVGSWREAPVAHVWGAGGGEVAYRFRAPRGERVPSRFVVRFRASSELPGAGAGALPTDVSRVSVWLGEVELGAVIAPVDDGHGAWLELAVDEPALLARAFSVGSGVRELRLRVAPDQPAGGLCLYEEDLEHPDTPAGRLELSWQIATSP